MSLPAIGERTIIGELTTTAAPLQPRVIVGPSTELPDIIRHERYLAGIAPNQLDLVAMDLSRRLEPANFAGGVQAPTETWAQVELRSWYGFGEQDRAGLWGGLVALVLLVLVGFVSSAAFATGTRRRVRDLGLLAATSGATPRQLGGLIRREALVLGLVGAALGAAMGLLGVTAGRPVIQFFAQQEFAARGASAGRVVAATDVVVPVVLGVLAALAAAWSPARTVSRVPLVTALAGRVPLRRVARWVAPASIVLTGLGVVVLLNVLTPAGATSTLYFASGSAGYWTMTTLRPVGYAVGVAAVVIGIAGLASPLLQRLGGLARRLPLRARLAVRDSARQRTRSAATVAATMVVLVVPVLALTTAASEADTVDGPSRIRGDVVVVTGPVYAEQALSPAPEMIAAARTAMPPVVAAITVERAISPSGWFSVLPDVDDPQAWQSAVTTDEIVAATPELLELLGTPDAPPDAVVVSSRWQRLSDQPTTGWLDVTGMDTLQVPVVVAPLAIEDAMIVAGQDVLDQLGLRAGSSTTLLQAERTLTRADANAVEVLGAAAGVTRAPLPDEAGGGRGPDAVLLSAVFGGAVLLALVIAAMTAALAATESDRDLRTMAAVGADPRDRPRFRAWQTGYQVLLGGALAVPAGILLAVTLRVANGYPDRTVVPWLLIVALITLVPLAVAVPFRLFSRPSHPGRIAPRPT